MTDNAHFRQSDNYSMPHCGYLNTTIDAINDNTLGVMSAESGRGELVINGLSAYVGYENIAPLVVVVGQTKIHIDNVHHGLLNSTIYAMQQSATFNQASPHYDGNSIASGVIEYKDVPAYAETWGTNGMIDEPDPNAPPAIIPGTARYMNTPYISPPQPGETYGAVNGRNIVGTTFQTHLYKVFVNDIMTREVYLPTPEAFIHVGSYGCLLIPPLIAAIPDGCTIHEAKCKLQVSEFETSETVYDGDGTYFEERPAGETTRSNEIPTDAKSAALLVTASGIHVGYSTLGFITGNDKLADCTQVVRNLYAARCGGGVVGYTVIPYMSASALAAGVSSWQGVGGGLFEMLPTVEITGDPYPATQGNSWNITAIKSSYAKSISWSGGASIANLWVRFSYPNGVISEMQTPRNISLGNDTIGQPVFPPMN